MAAELQTVHVPRKMTNTSEKPPSKVIYSGQNEKKKTESWYLKIYTLKAF